MPFCTPSIIRPMCHIDVFLLYGPEELVPIGLYTNAINRLVASPWSHYPYIDCHPKFQFVNSLNFEACQSTFKRD